MKPKNIQRRNWQTSGVRRMKKGRAVICAVMMLLALLIIFSGSSYAREHKNEWTSKKSGESYCAFRDIIGSPYFVIFVCQKNITLMKDTEWKGNFEISVDKLLIALSVNDIRLFGKGGLSITGDTFKQCIQAFKKGKQLVIYSGNKDEIFVIGLDGFNSAYKRSMKGQVDLD
jgi:hypothetical protein